LRKKHKKLEAGFVNFEEQGEVQGRGRASGLIEREDEKRRKELITRRGILGELGGGDVQGQRGGREKNLAENIGKEGRKGVTMLH